MLYMLICEDRSDDGLERRTQARPDHLAYLESLGRKVRAAGAMLADDETTPRGSILIIEAETMEAARAIADADPYAKAGVFDSVKIYPWRQAAGVVPLG